MERGARACESTKIARPNYNKSDGASGGAGRPHVGSSHADARINPRYHYLFIKVFLVISNTYLCDLNQIFLINDPKIRRVKMFNDL